MSNHRTGEWPTLLVEDNKDNRRWLCTIITGAFPKSKVFEAATFKQATDLLEHQEFGLTILDIGLPDGNGVDLVSYVNRYSSGAWCVFATIYDDDEHLFSALKAGADGYLLKSRPSDELICQLRRIVEGEPPLSPSIARRMMMYFSEQKSLQKRSLSPRESEVLRLLAIGKSNKQIANDLELSPNTVADYIKTIYKKLQVNNRTRAAHKAVNMGLLDQPH